MCLCYNKVFVFFFNEFLLNALQIVIRYINFKFS